MKLFMACLAILMMLAIAIVDTPAQVGGNWVKLALFPEAGEELYGIAAGGKLYVFGGLAPAWKPATKPLESTPDTGTPVGSNDLSNGSLPRPHP